LEIESFLGHAIHELVAIAFITADVVAGQAQEEACSPKISNPI
jgi:hypothetical protein